MLKKSKIKFLVYILTFYIRGKRILYVACTKKIKKCHMRSRVGALKKNLHGNKKYSFFPETCVPT
jgi:hypothetical protein